MLDRAQISTWFPFGSMVALSLETSGRNTMRRRFDDEFNSKVPLEASKVEKTPQELAEEYTVHPNQIIAWKKQLLENASCLFVR
jgi:transposase-like protein